MNGTSGLSAALLATSHALTWRANAGLTRAASFGGSACLGAATLGAAVGPRLATARALAAGSAGTLGNEGAT